MNKEMMPFEMPTYDLTGKVAIVTGGTKGLGKGIVMAYAYAGAKVVITSRHQDDCDKLAEEVKAMGGEAMGVKTDVQSKEEIENLIKKTVEKYGQLDILVNNAGVAVTQSIIDMTEDEYNMVMHSNMDSVFWASKEAAKIMKEQGSGKIINMASIGGLKGNYYLSTYGASKAAVINMTKSMAMEWGKFGINVNAICPGYVRTDMNAENLDNPKFKEKTLKTIPLRRFGEVKEIAAIALFLGSDAANIITGTEIVADMGATCGS